MPVATYTPSPVLGRFHEISIGTADIAESVAFYEKLGFSQCGTSDTWQHPYGVLSDGKLFIGLHQFKFPSPVITYVHPGVAQHSQVIEKLFLDPPAVLLAEQIDWDSIALENHVKVLDVEPAKLSQRCGRV